MKELPVSMVFAAVIPLLTCIVGGIGLAVATSKAANAAARQPEAADRIQSMLIIGGALIEATAVYGLIAAIMMIIKLG
ncbi:MAG: ATP F0F1 synthase subunit C [Clostridiales bacterium]|nr:ATP F0F1 synthase subunit C [Clostridiales bacterium]